MHGEHKPKVDQSQYHNLDFVKGLIVTCLNRKLYYIADNVQYARPRCCVLLHSNN